MPSLVPAARRGHDAPRRGLWQAGDPPSATLRSTERKPCAPISMPCCPPCANGGTRPARTARSCPRSGRWSGTRASHVCCSLRPTAGPGGPLRDIVEAVSQIGAACGSTGWAVVQYVVHPFMVAQWSRDGQDEVWGDDPKALVAGILIQSLGRYVRVDGGYRVSGRWPFVTGCGHLRLVHRLGLRGRSGGRARQPPALPHQARGNRNPRHLACAGPARQRHQRRAAQGVFRAGAPGALDGGVARRRVPRRPLARNAALPAPQLSDLRLRHHQRRGRHRAGDGRGVQRDRAQEGARSWRRSRSPPSPRSTSALPNRSARSTGPSSF